MGFLWGFGEFLASEPYLHALAIFVFSVLVAEFLLFFFKHVVERLVKKTKTTLDNQIVFKLENPIIVLVILVGILMAIKKIVTSAQMFESLIFTIMVFVIAYMFTGVSSILVSYWQKINKGNNTEAFHDEILPLMKSLINIVITITATVVILQLWGVNVATLVASIGIIGVILGFAFQDTMKNIFGGIALISDNSLKKHDIIKLDTGEVGEVIEMSLRSIKLKTLDNDYLMVPNGTLANSRFVNYALPTATMRVTIPVSVAYGSEPDFVKEVILSSLKGRSDVLTLPRREVRFVRMNDFSLDFDLLFYVKNYKDRYLIEDSVTTELYKLLQLNEIEIPFPTRTVYNMPLKKSTKQKKTKMKSSEALKNKKYSKKSSTKK